ncbi:N-acetylmuramoyl-L-alanine amidase [Lysobacteraceae bacterium NML120232]|nr:N-acetylmuramoyl-L-alanine amidase [Xanthomonadaceae bacterium NML120232]PJK11530.1 N-acetylmuramoyl-L-alanine amidase [Xanthomonadaceae bacterium NML08-0793]
MRVKGLRIEQILLGLALLVALVWNLAEAREVRGVSLHETPSGTRAEITLDSRVEYRVLRLSEPERLVVDMSQTELAKSLKLPAATGIVKSVRSGQPVSGTARIVFDLGAPVVAIGPNMEWRDGKAILILEWPGDGIAAIAAAVQNQGAAPATTATGQGTLPSTAVAGTVALPPGNAEAGQQPSTSPAPAAAVGQTAASSAPTAVGTAENPPQTQAQAAQIASSTPTQNPQPAVPRPPQTGTVSPAPVRSMQEMNRRSALRPVIVAIDAGHGGQDPGAVGAGGTREKDITLAIARELARQVDATPGLKAYLTRNADFFIPLAERYQRARRANADVFISIHADAAENRNARGSSVYVLSTRGATSQAARWLADRENAADLVGGVRLQGKEGTLASVLLDLSQSATQRASERMANEVLDGLKRVGKTHKDQIERANFVVLRSPDVPSMLVETAFISNPEEEARLKSASFQRQLARAVLDGIHTHFTRMPPPGTHYAARRESRDSGAGEARTASP